MHNSRDYGWRVMSWMFAGCFLLTISLAGTLQAAGPGQNPPPQGGGAGTPQGPNSGKGQQKPKVSPKPSPSQTPTPIQPKENTTEQAIRG
jgi:hypothetical protein